jgi:hypothetical protein
MKLILFQIFFVSVAKFIVCPELDCVELDKNEVEFDPTSTQQVCFKHSGTDPVLFIKIEKCLDTEDDTYMCNAEPNKFAWVNNDH